MLTKCNNIKKQVKINTDANTVKLIDRIQYDEIDTKYDETNEPDEPELSQIDIIIKKYNINRYRKNMLELVNINKIMKNLVYDLVNEILDKNINIPKPEDGDYIIKLRKHPTIRNIKL